MRRKTFLTLVASIALFVGAVALLAPAALLESKGVASNPAAQVWVREVGIALIAMGFIAFQVRTHSGSPTLRTFLWGNAVLQLGLLPIEILAYKSTIITQVSGIVPNSILHVVLASGFIYYAATMKVHPLPVSSMTGTTQA